LTRRKETADGVLEACLRVRVAEIIRSVGERWRVEIGGLFCSEARILMKTSPF
jgi:hypothetical protein